MTSSLTMILPLCDRIPPVTPASLEPLDVLRLDGLFGEAKRVTADYAFETKTRGASEQAETTPLKGWHEPADPATAGENGRRFRVPGYLSDQPDDSEKQNSVFREDHARTDIESGSNSIRNDPALG